MSNEDRASSRGAALDRRTFIAAAATLPVASQIVSHAVAAPAAAAEAVTLTKRTPQLWQVTVSNPPFNLVVPEMVSELHRVVVALERDPEVKVVLLRSGVEDYFINHFDLSKAKTSQSNRRRRRPPPGPIS